MLRKEKRPFGGMGAPRWNGWPSSRPKAAGRGGRGLLAELARLVLQTQMEEFATCAHVCRGCLTLRRPRDGRTRKVQTLFGTIIINAPRISACPCRNHWGVVDVSQSPLAELLPDRCTPALRRSQAELSARHSHREGARLLAALLPCDPMSHATMRHRTHRVAADLELMAIAQPKDEPETAPSG